jgi:hypothetical protein
MVDRNVGLDMQHCLLVMKSIAQSHAASAVLHLMNPVIFKPVIESFYCERLRTALELIFQIFSKSEAKEVEKWPIFNDRFAWKLHRWLIKHQTY